MLKRRYAAGRAYDLACTYADYARLANDEEERKHAAVREEAESAFQRKLELDDQRLSRRQSMADERAREKRVLEKAREAHERKLLEEGVVVREK